MINFLLNVSFFLLTDYESLIEYDDSEPSSHSSTEHVKEPSEPETKKRKRNESCDGEFIKYLKRSEEITTKIYEEEVKQTKIMENMFEEDSKRTKLMEKFVQDNSELKQAFITFLNK